MYLVCMYDVLLENGSHYRASELIPCIFGVFKNKTEQWGGEEQQQ